MKIKEMWDSLSAEARRRTVLLGIGGIIVLVSSVGYMNKDKRPLATTGGRKTVSLEPDLLKQSQVMESQKEISRRDEKLLDLQKQLEELSRTGKLPAGTVLPNGSTVPAGAGGAAGGVAPGGAAGVPNPLLGSGGNNKGAVAGIPGMPAANNTAGGIPQNAGVTASGKSGKGKHTPGTIPPLPNSILPPSSGQQAMIGPDGQMVMPPGGSAAPSYTETEIGEIGLVQGNKDAIQQSSDKKKASERSVYLPPSFMQATLLSGLDAPTSEGGKGRPVPVLIRISAPAVLPNETRASLKGCFVLADGTGNLGTERAELTLVSLTCLDRRGNALIDQKVKGFVVDADGKIALKGKVVAKMGSMIARSMIAGFFGGVGDAVKSSSTTTSISPLGGTSTIQPQDMAMAGAGAGLSAAFKDVQKFYMTLANATLPVIEVGATRPLTVVISEGIELKIRKLKGNNR